MANLGLKDSLSGLRSSQIRGFINNPQNRLKLLAPINERFLNPLIKKYQSEKKNG